MLKLQIFSNDKKISGESPKLNDNQNNGIVSTSDLYIPPKVMTSHSSSIITLDSTSVVKRELEEAHSKDSTQYNPSLLASNNPNINNLSFSAAQVIPVDQAQLSNMEVESKDDQDVSVAGVDDIQICLWSNLRRKIL